MDIIIRPMERDDWSDVVEIFIQGMQTNMATLDYTFPSYDVWDQIHLPSCRLVAEIDGDVVGWTALSPFSTRECYSGVAELSVYVNNNKKGMGVGKALLTALEEAAVKAGYWSLQANIIQENLASIAAHEKCGFKKIGVRERLGKDRFGVWRSVVLMEYRIQTDKAGGCDCAYVKNASSECYG